MYRGCCFDTGMLSGGYCFEMECSVLGYLGMFEMGDSSSVRSRGIECELTEVSTHFFNTVGRLGSKLMHKIVTL